MASVRARPSPGLSEPLRSTHASGMPRAYMRETTAASVRSDLATPQFVFRAVHIRSRWKLSDIRGCRYETEQCIDVRSLIDVQFTPAGAAFDLAGQKRAEPIAAK